MQMPLENASPKSAKNLCAFKSLYRENHTMIELRRLKGASGDGLVSPPCPRKGQIQSGTRLLVASSR